MPWNTSLESTAQRFWGKVEKTSNCWLWRGALTGRGYGRFSYKNKPMQAHRMSWIFAHGDIPFGKVVCHHCDNPLCVKPDHLFLGTHSENVDDMVRKGRGPRGKITANQAREILASRRAGTSTQFLSARYGISRASIWSIEHGLSWRLATGVTP